MITYDEFKKTELRTAKITFAERVEGSEKLIKLQLDLGVLPAVVGESALLAEGEQAVPKRETRQIVAGIGKTYEPEVLIGRQIVIVANLEPRKLMGIESHGMLLAVSDENGLSLIGPDREVISGSNVG